MNFTICISTRILQKHRPVHLWTLTVMLKFIGVEPLEEVRLTPGRKCYFRRGKVIRPGLLYDYLDAAHAAYLKAIVKLHPDKGGDAVQCATLNAVWTLIKQRILQRL